MFPGSHTTYQQMQLKLFNKNFEKLTKIIEKRQLFRKQKHFLPKIFWCQKFAWIWKNHESVPCAPLIYVWKTKLNFFPAVLETFIGTESLFRKKTNHKNRFLRDRSWNRKYKTYSSLKWSFRNNYCRTVGDDTCG